MIQIPRNATLAEALYRDIDKDAYLQEIYGDLLYNYSIKLFGSGRKLREINIKDALRFSDLLSKSVYTPTLRSNADQNREDKFMRLKHKVRINIANKNSKKQEVLQSEHRSITKRLLTFLFGEFL